MTAGRVLLWLGLLLGWAGQVTAATFAEVVPWRGPVPAVVTVSGSDLPTEGTWTVGGTPVAVQSASASAVTLSLGAGVGTGELEWVPPGGEPVRTGLIYEVSRALSGQFNPPSPVTRAGYVVGWIPHVVELGVTSGFTTEVPLDRPAVVWAFRGDNDPVWGALVLPDDATVTVDATSTAIALLTWVGPLSSRSPERLATIRTVLQGKPETAALAAALAAGAADGLDPMEDPRVEAAFVAALQAAIADPALDPAAATPVRQMRSLAPPTKSAGMLDHEFFVLTPGGAGGTAATPSRLKFSLNPPVAGQELGSLHVEVPYRSPLDWILELVRLQPSYYPEGRNSVLALTENSAPPGREERALGTGFVRARLYGQDIDLIERAMNALVEKLTGPDERSPGDFPIPVNEPGLYAINAYSGNIYHANSSLSGVASQQALITLISRESRHLSATVANLTIAAIDAIALAIDISDVVPPSYILKSTQQIAVDVEKALQVYREAGADLEPVFIMDLFRTTVAAIGKVVTAEGVKGGVTVVVGRFSKTVGKNLVRVVDIVGKTATALQAAERLYGLLGADAFAVERAVLLVGDPFNARLTGFYPLSGRRGTVVQISGSNFPTNPVHVRVSFANFGTGTPPPKQGELELEVLSVSPTAILARVPAGWEEEFGSERHAYVCVQRTDYPSRESTSIGLPEPFVRFRYTGLPELFHTAPNPVMKGGIVVVHGRDFDTEMRAKVEILIDGVVQFGTEPSTAGPDRLAFRLPGTVTAGTHALSLRVEGVDTNSVPLVVEALPVEQTGNLGLTITITKADFSNTPDGEISILEAFLIARGALGRPIESHPPSDFDPGPWRQRETDWVNGDDEFGFGGGLAVVDQITVLPGLWSGGPIVVSAPQGLPEPGPGDSYDLRGLIFDGGGADVPGWDLAGADGCYARVHLRNYGGHGLHLREGARRVRLDATIEQVGGHGVFLDGDVTESQFFALKVSQTGGDALRLSGAGVLYNDFALAGVSTTEILGLLEHSGGYGLRIDDGASHNHVHPGTVRHNLLGGILVTGETTGHNVIGRVSSTVPRSSDVVKNGGHGLLFSGGTKYNTVRYLMCAGNQGDGYRVEGSGTSFNEIGSPGTGLDIYPEGSVDPSRALRNTGAGIRITGGAADNRVGGRQPGSFGWRGGVGNNEESGVIVEGAGTDRTIISRLNVGDSRALVELSGSVPNPNGMHGIHVRDGAKFTVIGDVCSPLDVHILGAPNGAAILIEGEGTDGTVIVGNQIGTDHGYNGRISGEEIRDGIVIRDGPRNTRVGLPGGLMFDSSFTAYRGYNVIGNALEAGIRIERAGGSVGEQGVLADANVLHNNRIGLGDSGEDAGNRVGIVLGVNSGRNEIGGREPGEANDIANNTHAGIHFDGLVVLQPSERPRFGHNRILRTGATGKAPAATDAALGPPAGVGLLFDNGSTGFTVGEGWEWPLVLEDNRVGAYFHEVERIGLRSASVRQSYQAGVVVKGGREITVGDSAGGGLEIVSTRAGGVGSTAGILLVDTAANRVQGNLLGRQRDGQAAANGTPGIVLRNTSDTLIGGSAVAHGNIVVGSAGPGVVLTGAGTTGNVLASNRIGIDPAGVPRPNQGAGVLIENGASGNSVGGPVAIGLGAVPVPGGNVIAHNQGAGVEVSGAATVGNSILDNSITNNAGAGILLTGGGNRGQQHPPTAVIEDGRLYGTVPDLGAIPVGSLIQAFTDSDPLDPEGAAFIGETTVGPGGFWEIDGLMPIVFPNFSLTATHPVTGDTSAFGFGIEWLLGLEVARRDGGSPQTRTIALGGTPTPVHALTLQATGADVRVTELRLRAGGTLHDAADLTEVRLYRDRDGDGLIGPGDPLLAAGGVYDSDDGELVWELEDVRVPEGTPIHWLVAYLASSAPAGATLTVRVPDAEAVTASTALAAGLPLPVPVLGSFPVESDLLTLGAGASHLAAWRETYFNADERADPAISGHTADPDGDGLPNLLEYALGRHPRQRDADGVVTAAVADGRWTFTYVRRAPPLDARVTAAFSHDLALWNAYGEVVESVDVTPLGSDLERVTLRTNLVPGDPAAVRLFARVEAEPED